MADRAHKPVMLAETLRMLDPRPGETFVDVTLGAGGHASAVAEKVAPGGRVIALDADSSMIETARERITGNENIEFINENFRRIRQVLDELGAPPVDGVLADLGLATDQLLDPERGFSFSEEGPLDMRIDAGSGPSAAAFIARAPEKEIERILSEYGEERHARRIARAIVRERVKNPVRTTGDLKRIVLAATPPGKTRIHRATRTFQAVRIAVNDELAALGELLDALPHVLAAGGRTVIISFHSLEDRLVKHAFRKLAREGVFEILTKKPLTAAPAEVRENPRSRSAKLRAARKAAA